MKIKQTTKKYRYAWMSFSEYEQKEIQTYVNDMAKQGYQMSKIARFYLRFKYSGQHVEPYYVQGARRHYFGHWYWQYSHTPLPVTKIDRSRFRYLFGVVLFLSCLTFISLFTFNRWHALVFYSDIFLVIKFLLPLFSVSFLLDYLGRLYECWRAEKPRNHSYRFARFRALSLGLNMIFRYLLLFGLFLPTVLKELHILVVFIILLVGIYEVAYYYLPHRHRLRLMLLSVVISLIACSLMAFVNEKRPFQKDQVDYDMFHVMRLEDFVDEEDFDDQYNYARQVHRYTSTSLLVPLYYQRTEIMRPIHENTLLFETYSAFSYCCDVEVANHLFWKKADCYDLVGAKRLDHQKWQTDEIILLDEKHILLRKDMIIMEFSGTFDLTDEHHASLLYELVQQSTLDLLAY